MRTFTPTVPDRGNGKPPPSSDNDSDDPTIRYFGDLQRLELKPGDQFVLTVPKALTKDQHDHIQSAWKKFVGGDAEEMRLLVLDGGLKLGAIHLAVNA